MEILTVSRLFAEERMKGVDHSITALASLADRYPGLIYNIVGKGSDKPRLIEEAKRLGLADRVIFLQDLTDAELAEHYKRCDIFLLPSGQEGFGIVFLEAMRFSKPCIGGNAGGTPEVIEDGRTGLLVPYGDPVALEAAIDKLLSNPELREEMGRRGRERLEQHFTFEQFRRRLEGHLVSLLKD